MIQTLTAQQTQPIQAITKLTNKDKMAIRQALFRQIENITVGSTEGQFQELAHIDPLNIRKYAESVIKLYTPGIYKAI